MIMTSMYACAPVLYLILYVHMVSYYLAIMYSALILLCQELRNKDVESIILLRHQIISTIFCE